jgi:hypothetical protein
MKLNNIKSNLYFNINPETACVIAMVIQGHGWKANLGGSSADWLKQLKQYGRNGYRFAPTPATGAGVFEIYSHSGLTTPGVKSIDTIADFEAALEALNAKPTVAPIMVNGYVSEVLPGLGVKFGCMSFTWGDIEQLKNWAAENRATNAAEVIPMASAVVKNNKRIDLNVTVDTMYAIVTYLRTLYWTDQLGDTTGDIRGTAVKVGGGYVHISLHTDEERLAFRKHVPMDGARTVANLRGFLQLTEGAASSEAWGRRDIGGHSIHARFRRAGGAESCIELDGHHLTWADFDKAMQWAEKVRRS